MTIAAFLLLWLMFYFAFRLLRPRHHFALPCRIPPSREQRIRIYQRDGFQCRHCHTTRGLQIDHIWPVCRGGRTVDSNLQTLCRRCNVKKGARV